MLSNCPTINILHVTAYHSSISVGGTEIYIDSLCESFSSLHGNIVNHCLVLSKIVGSKVKNENTIFCDPSPSDGKLRDHIVDIIDRTSPRIVCIHTLTSTEFLVAEICNERAIPYIYFHHASQWCCYQGNFKFANKLNCSYFLCASKCALCMHIPKYGLVKSCVKQLLDWTILRNRNQWGWYHIAKNRLLNIQVFFAYITRCIVFSDYDFNIFRRNGVSTEKIQIVPQCLPRNKLEGCMRNFSVIRNGKLKFGYVGRVVEIKGVDILLEAYSRLPQHESELHIYGCDFQADYCANLVLKFKNVPGIFFHSILSAEEIVSVYSLLDILCIPSRVHETGPLTLLEGLCSGCKIAGVSTIGQIDVLRKYGEVIQQNTPEKWLVFFNKCLAEKETVRSGKISIPFEDFSMDAVARAVIRIGTENQ